MCKVNITTAGHTIFLESTCPVEELAALAEGLWQRTRFGNDHPGFGP
jgi:hypothetical protein